MLPARLEILENESLFILREAAAQCEKPVLLHSLGKDSAVLLHLAKKAFYPAPPPFPLLHIDTGWKFKEMIAYRERYLASGDMPLIVQRSAQTDIAPFTHAPGAYTDIMKTQTLKTALAEQDFDGAIGGARRDEDVSRAKERVFSLRDAHHRWDPRRQRAEPWRLYNGHKKAGESLRIFPLSNWCEIDIWRYIDAENIPVVPLYFAAERPVVMRGRQMIVVDDARLPLEKNETPQLRRVRFRTLGCYPLTGALESNAVDVPAIIAELEAGAISERHGRLIDHDGAGAMERKKQAGYF